MSAARLEKEVRLIRPESELGVSPFFVGRRQELQAIDAILSPRIKSGQQMQGGILNIYGPWGVGKSAMLQKITAVYARDNNPPRVTHPSISAHVDINTVLKEKSEDGKRKVLLCTLWGQLVRQIGEQEPVYGMLTEEQLSTGFVLALKRWENKYTPVLVFDSVDRLDAKTAKWLGSQITGKVFRTQDVSSSQSMFIFGGRKNVYWDDFQTRKRTATIHLQNLSAADTNDLVQGLPYLKEGVYNWSHGHPEIARRLAIAANKLDVARFVQQSEAEQTIQVVAADVLSRAKGDLFAECDPDEVEKLRPALEASIALRLISSEVIKHMLQWSDKTSTAQIEKLRSFGILDWDPDKNTHTIHPQLQPWLRLEQQLNSPEEFQRLHKAAYDYNLDHLAHYPKYALRYAPEILYHAAEVGKFPEAFARIIALYKTSGKASVEEEDWGLLQQQIHSDTQLKRLITPMQFDLVLSFIREQINP